MALLHKGIVEEKSVCLNKIAQHQRSRARAFSRTLRNPSVNLSLLKKNITQKTQSAVEGVEHVLAIQDWTEMDYRSKLGKNELKTLGVNGKKGYYQFHPMIAFEAENLDCLGIAAINYHLQYKKKNEKRGDYQGRPVKEKKSYCWIKTAEEAKPNLEKAKQITVIGDREEDFYMAFVRIPDEKTHLLTRSAQDRYLKDGKTKLWEWMDKLEVKGSYQVKVKERVKKGRKYTEKARKQGKREAKVEVGFGEVEIKKPKNCKDLDAPESLKVWVINAKESKESVPEGEEGLHWRLITTHKIKDLEKAQEIIGWYDSRWEIEQVFRTLKKKGLDIESSEVEDEEGLLKLAMIAIQAIITIMQLMKARDGNERRPATDVFKKEEIKALEAIEKKVEGKTEKQKNPWKKHTLSWAAWVIARLGGWDAYCSSPPGPITFSRGIDEFYSIFRGWLIAKNLVPD